MTLEEIIKALKSASTVIQSSPIPGLTQNEKWYLERLIEWHKASATSPIVLGGK